MQPEAHRGAMLGQVRQAEATEVALLHAADPRVGYTERATDVSLAKATGNASLTKLDTKLRLKSTPGDRCLIHSAETIGHGCDTRDGPLLDT